jgi:arabinose-5-phosphate isomerase
MSRGADAQRYRTVNRMVNQGLSGVRSTGTRCKSILDSGTPRSKRSAMKARLATRSGGSDAAIQSAMRTVATEQAGIAALAAAHSKTVFQSPSRKPSVCLRPCRRPGHRHRRRQKRTYRLQARRHARLDRNAGLLRASGRSQSRRSRYDRQGRCRSSPCHGQGETSELKGIVAYARRFSIPLIALTAGETSTLAREATVVLLLPRVQEACPHGLAPDDVDGAATCHRRRARRGPA